MSIWSQSLSGALKFALANPAMAGAAAVGAGGLTMLAAPAVVVAPAVGVLNLVGFGSGGVVAGSLAAAQQAAIGNVVAPSIFSALTSTAAGGYGAAALGGAVQAVGGVVAGSAAGIAAWAAL